MDLLNDLDKQVLIACVVVVGLVIILVAAMLFGYTVLIGGENTENDGRRRFCLFCFFCLKRDKWDVCVYF